MANFSSVNKLMKIQKLFNSKNAHLSHYACRTLSSVVSKANEAAVNENVCVAVSVSVRSKESNCLFSDDNSNSTKHAKHKSNIVCSYPRLICNRRSYCTTTSDKDQTTSIDEFRAREEKREQQFEEKVNEKTQNEEEKEKNAKADAMRVKILEAALHHVPTLGWTRNAIVQGAEEAGYPSVVHGMFPEGGFCLVSFFNSKCNDELLKELQKATDNAAKDVSNPAEFLVRFVRMRIEMIVPYKGQWAQALALITMPQNAPTALAQLLTLVDDICYYSGDRSVDMGWYTRRVGLAFIFKSTELYMLQDSSPGHCKTWEFLQARMDEAIKLQMILHSTEDVTAKFQRSFNSAFITARNILGLGYNRP